MSDITIINRIINQPNATKDFVYVFSGVSGTGNTDLVIPNLNNIAAARGMALKDMNIVVVYLGSTNTSNGNITLKVGCDGATAPLNLANNINSINVIGDILNNPNVATDKIITYYNLFGVGNYNVSVDLDGLEKVDTTNTIPWRKMNIVVAWLGETNTITNGNLNFSIGCPNQIVSTSVNKNILIGVMLFFVCCMCMFSIISMLAISMRGE